MRSTTFALSAAALAAAANGESFFSCMFSDFETTLAYGAMGFQSDTSDSSSDCVLQCNQVSSKVSQVYASLANYDFSDWAAPLYLVSELGVASTDLFSFCGTTNFAKQLSARTSSASGALDLFATIVASFAFGYWLEDENTLYTSFQSFMSADTCSSLSQNLGTVLANAVKMEVPLEYYADQLSFDLADEVLP